MIVHVGMAWSVIADVALVVVVVVFVPELDAVDGTMHDLFEADSVADPEWLCMGVRVRLGRTSHIHEERVPSGCLAAGREAEAGVVAFSTTCCINTSVSVCKNTRSINGVLCHNCRHHFTTTAPFWKK